MSDQGRSRQHIAQLSRDQIKALFSNIEYLDDPSKPPPDVGLKRLAPRAQEFIRHWTRVIARTDGEVARLFAERAPEALEHMDFDGVEAWLLKALEAFDRRGLGWAVEVLNTPARFAEIRTAEKRILPLVEIATLLRRLVTGLGGRELRLESAPTPYTDTETLFLPGELKAASREINFRLYKAMAVHHWAQTCYGTWRAEVLAILRAFPEQSAVLLSFAALERLRLDACIAREFPGAHRDMQALSRELDGQRSLSEPWRRVAAAFDNPTASGLDSCAWLDRVQHLEPPPPACYHGDFFPQQVQTVLDARLKRERDRLRLVLGTLQQQLDDSNTNVVGTDDNRARTRKPTEGFTLTQQTAEHSSRMLFRLRLDEHTIKPSNEMQSLLASIAQDLGAVPEDYLGQGGRRYYDAEFIGPPSPAQAGGFSSTDSDSALCYPEWDYTRQRLRVDYCTVREYTVKPGDAEFVASTLSKYRGLSKSIRRTFEAMLGESRLERHQTNGDDIDLDALVEAYADARHGEELKDAVYTRLRNTERSIAVMFMVDMSGSTKGWVNDAEREALVLLCEALETIGDSYAIYGFSGRTHKRVEIYRVKRFDERYDLRVKSRISGITPRSYTRMGAPIRHLGGMLKQTPARHKLLITLSDGKPEDYGSYYGKYGIEDTRHALLELRRDGVHPFCITIDREGGDYLPHMYGAANYACIDEVSKLPLKVADIYRKLTT